VSQACHPETRTPRPRHPRKCLRKPVACVRLGTIVSAHGFLKGSRARTFFWALVGQAGPTFLQLLNFIVVARLLGAEMTGLFFLVVAVSVIASSFVGFGAGGLVLREVSRDKSRAGVVFGQAQAMSLVTFPLLLPLASAIAYWVVGGAIAVWVVIAIAASELLAARLLTTSWTLFVAREEQIRASLLICLMPFARMVMASLLIFWPQEARLEILAILYALISFTVTLAAMVIVRRVIGPSPLSLRGFEGLSGLSFSMMWLNVALQSESDKVMLGLFGSPSMVAVYSIASRLMDGAAMPPRALRVFVQARLFRAGAAGSAGAYRVVRRLMPFVGVYGLAVWFAFWALAPIVSRLFGPGFEGMAAILPVLGALPLLRAVSEFGAEIFVSSDKPYVQATVQTVMTLFRIILGLVLIPTYGTEGAIATSLLMAVTSGIVLWGIGWRVR